ncbi:MAG: START domain-containing protein [Gammaproteobacteria bacterium]|jgi:hypothetical protein|nr:START domain-containing protein [Gammaproteobacteria bacterium]MBT4492351.1 START domain-containing protein [Gammaproteobacteria bacterium]MBT7370289.1 START domain-containing protein [Gammaproteobacteria bacterium]
MRVALFLLLVVSIPAAGTEDDWAERLDEDGIRVLARPVSGSKYQEFKATVELEATTAHVVALLQDNSACARWVFRCVGSTNIEQLSNTERYFHQVTDLPFPARSRDAVFHARIYYTPDGSITIELQSTPNKLSQTKHVRIIETYGHYLLQPLDKGRVLLTWQLYVDPAGVLPAWLVNSMLTDMPYKSLMVFKELVREAPYRNAIFKYDDAGTPIDILFN